MQTKFLLLDKSHYENGLMSGKYFKSIIGNNMDFSNYEQLLNDPNLRKEVDYALAKVKNEFPEYYEESRGKANGLGVDEYKFFCNLCPEIFKRLYEKCTTVCKVKDDGNIVLCHNEDDKWVDFNFAMVKVKLDEKNWFVSNDAYDTPWGNGFGYNSYGIIKSINYIHQDEFIHNDYLPRFFHQRYTAEAKSLEDLVERCKVLNASGFHMLAVDINRKKAISIEVHPDFVTVEEVNDYYAHSNHYIHGDVKNNPRQDSGANSIFRYEKAYELISKVKGDVDPFEVKKLLSYQEDSWRTSIFQKMSDPSNTINNMLYDTSKPNDIYLDIYPSKEEFKLEYCDDTQLFK